jgi:hypothetical protein
MSADKPTPEEEQYSALFTAGEEALAAGQKLPPPTDTSPELRSRLEQDLACVQLLRQALGNASSANPLPRLPGTVEHVSPPLLHRDRPERL